MKKRVYATLKIVAWALLLAPLSHDPLLAMANDTNEGPEETSGSATVQEIRPQSWQEAQKRVEAIVSKVEVGDGPLTAAAEKYAPEDLVIHEEKSHIDWPVRLSKDQWRDRLSEKQFRILRREGTEKAFENAFYDNKQKGIYFSAATGQPLFDSEDKYESGTGWPSFTRPIDPLALAYILDSGFLSTRIEVVDSLSGSHIGHVFQDGPEPTGQRYCVNSAALIFVAEHELPPPLLLPGRTE